ncbi:sulfite exporter TauE/SafE family protein [Mangrovibacterium lignilyticum]|uniref:sulfite exporter TauE/SafE family protein n=1 Tax=Mangrovibacterium lignilyticum TaxID=2668052 RepID=UPI0013D4F752|nr:sulfite exporter TauE/SafE family protein [Mangrovibacterium lignilyticum]
MEWIISVIVILMASLLKGMTGFGFALLALPILTIFFPMQVLVPAMTLFNLFTSLYILANIKLKIDYKYLIPMLLASFIGIPAGVQILQYLPERTMELTTGISIFSLSMVFLLSSNKEVPESRKTKPIVFAGFLSGLMGSSMSIGGPPIALAMNRKGYAKERFRKMFALMSVINAVIATVLYVSKGMFLAFSLKFAIFLFPVMLLGSKLGDVLSKKINQIQFKRMILYLNMVLGLFIVARILLHH